VHEALGPDLIAAFMHWRGSRVLTRGPLSPGSYRPWGGAASVSSEARAFFVTDFVWGSPAGFSSVAVVCFCLGVGLGLSVFGILLFALGLVLRRGIQPCWIWRRDAAAFSIDRTNLRRFSSSSFSTVLILE